MQLIVSQLHAHLRERVRVELVALECFFVTVSQNDLSYLNSADLICLIFEK
jgi:hypothetical protein